MLLAAIILSSAMCAIHLMGSGLCIGKDDGTGFTFSLVLAATSAFITYTLFTFNN